MTDLDLSPVLALQREDWSHGWLALRECASRLDPARAATFDRYVRRAIRRAVRRGFRQPGLVQAAEHWEPTYEPPCRVDDLDEVASSLSRLSPRERRILILRALGLGRAAVGAELGVTGSRVGQLERAALRRAAGA